MREIKFRAWLTLSDYDDDGNDKDYHGMATVISVHSSGDIGFSVDEGHHVFGGDVFERALENGTAYEYEEWCHWEGQFNLMQYTGLKDKNGVEIYEGDIVKILYTDWINQDDYKILQVIYDISSYELMNNGHSLYDINPGVHGWIEVIGNIYENPELLAKTQP